MARERYLLDDSEETIHNGVITADTKKDKFQNWWYYNSKILLIVFFCVLVAGSIIWSIVTKVRPDYTIAVMNEVIIGSDALELLEKHIAQYGVDVNGDGEVIVSIQNYSVATSTDDNAYDAQAQQAAYAKFAADMSVGESIIWITDPVGYYSMGDIEGVFQELDVDVPLSDKTKISLTEVPALGEYNFEGFESYYLTAENMQEIFSKMSLSIRTTEDSFIGKDDDLVKYHEECVKLFENLMSNTKTVE